MIKLLAQAGGWGQEKRIRSPQVAASASEALTTGASPPTCIDTGPPTAALMRCHTAQPTAIPVPLIATLDEILPIPVVSVSMEVNPLPFLGVFAEGRGIYVRSDWLGGDGDIQGEGTYMDLWVGVRGHWKYLTGTVGYKFIGLDIAVEDGLADIEFQGLLATVGMQF